jgi:DNA repair exonuclease SbcCD ATPase subunit
MTDVNIGVKIQADGTQAVKSINDLNKEIKAASEAMKSAKIGSEEYKAAQEKLQQAQEQLSNSTKEHISSFSQLKEHLSSSVPAFGGAAEGAAGLGRQFLALLANPIVLLIAGIVAGLKLLYNAFTSTQAGAEKMEAFFSGLKATLTVITDRLISFGNAIIKLFQGDFSGAADAAKASVRGLKDEIGSAYNRAVELTEKLQKIKMEELQDAKDQQRRKARLAELKEMLNDEDISIQERKRMAKELKEEQEKDFKTDYERTKQKAEAEIALIRNGRKEENLSYEDKKKINDLEMEADKAKQEGKQEGVRINRLVRNLDKQEQAAAIQAAAKEKARKDAELKEDERRQAARLKFFFDNLKAIDQKREQDKKAAAELKKEEDEVLDAAAKEDEKREKEEEQRVKASIHIQQEASQKKIEIAKQEQQAKDELLRLESAGLNAFAELAGKQTAAGKALAVASTTISTYEAAQGAYKSQMALATPDAPIRAALAAGVAIATGLARVKGILAVDVPGGGGGGSTPSNPSAPSAPLAPTNNTTTLNAGSIQQLGNAASPRAFVVESDVTNNQARITMLNRAARIG